MGGRRGRLGLLADSGTELEIEALCGDWILPPVEEESAEEEDDEYDDNAAENVIVVCYVESTCKRLRLRARQSCLGGAATRREKGHQVSFGLSACTLWDVSDETSRPKNKLTIGLCKCTGLQATWKHT